MQREITIDKVVETLNNENIEDSIIVKRKNKSDVIIMDFEKYKKLFEMNLVEKLREAEKQIKDGEVIDADIVFKEMRAKYGY